MAGRPPLRRVKKMCWPATTAAAQPEPALRLVPSEPSAGRDGVKIERGYQLLRRGIMSGAYGPDERLVEAPLTRLLGISRNTLRTVLARLQQDGLVVIEPNRGAHVRAFSPDEAHDILRVREALDGLVAALAAERATALDLAHLRAITAEMESAIVDDDPVRYSCLNNQFHEQVRTAAGSPHAAALIDSLHFPLLKRQFRPLTIPGRKAESLAEHLGLLRAIEAGDAAAAEGLARQHVQHIRAILSPC